MSNRSFGWPFDLWCCVLLGWQEMQARWWYEGGCKWVQAWKWLSMDSRKKLQEFGYNAWSPQNERKEGVFIEFLGNPRGNGWLRLIHQISRCRAKVSWELTSPHILTCGMWCSPKRWSGHEVEGEGHDMERGTKYLGIGQDLLIKEVLVPMWVRGQVGN